MKDPCIRFRRIAGSSQIVIETAEDLIAVSKTDPAYWAVMGMPVNSILFDKDFICCINSDGSDRISPNELLEALRWMLSLLTDLTGVEQQSGTLKISSIRKDIPLGKELLENARLILGNLGKPNADELTLEEISERKNLISDPLHNGDGVIPPTGTDPELDAYIQDAMACSGSSADLSGVPGIDEEKLKDFNSRLLLCRDWRNRRRELEKFGSKTLPLHELYVPLKEKIDEYFTFCSASALQGNLSSDRFAPSRMVDPLDMDSMTEFLKKAPLSVPDDSRVLNADHWINPEWKEKIEAFLSKLSEMKLIAKKRILTGTEWKKIDSALSPVTAWLAEVPEQKFPDLDDVRLDSYCEGKLFDRVMAEIASDIAVQKQIESYSSLRKLILYQKNMLEFLNNYVNLERLFDPERPSILQPGYLVMDGRHFTLASLVINLAEHKKIIQRSDICVMYVELTTGAGTKAARKMTLAVAVTSGTMRNIFVGKTGIFIGRDGTEWLAKVIDMVQQPVSIKEALQMPFYRLGEVLTKQADKFFSAKSKAAEDGAFKNLQSSTTAPVQPQPAKVKAAQTPAVSGSMMLMGGGVGIAAIGSAFAFIAKSLKGISILNVLTVFFGIILVISAPVIFVSLLKLMNRKVSDFLAAGGWAVNPQMKLSRKMGMIFTHVPVLGLPHKNVHDDLINTFSKRYLPEKKHKLFFLIVLIILILGGLAYGYIRGAAKYGWPLPQKCLHTGCSVKTDACRAAEGRAGDTAKQPHQNQTKSLSTK